MIASVIRWSARNVVFVLIGTLFLVAAGLYSVSRIPLDALPDLSDTQVILYTEYPGQAPQVVEDQVTYPLTTAMLSVPKSKVVRGFSFFGASFVYIIFEDGTDIYWARSRVLEYLNFAAKRLPDDLDYMGIDTLSMEAREKLTKCVRGQTGLLWSAACLLGCGTARGSRRPAWRRASSSARALGSVVLCTGRGVPLFVPSRGATRCGPGPLSPGGASTLAAPSAPRPAAGSGRATSGRPAASAASTPRTSRTFWFTWRRGGGARAAPAARARPPRASPRASSSGGSWRRRPRRRAAAATRAAMREARSRQTRRWRRCDDPCCCSHLNTAVLSTPLCLITAVACL